MSSGVGPQRRLGDLPQQRLLARHALEVLDERGDDLLLGARVDPVHSRDQQLRQSVKGELVKAAALTREPQQAELVLRTRSGDRRPTDEHCSRAATLIPGSQQADEDG